MKKFLSLILTIVLIMSVFPLGGIGSLTALATFDGYYRYSVSNNETTIIDVDTSINGDITIPDTLGGYPVTKIGESAFQGCKRLTSITVPNSVLSIGEAAFKGCTALESITLPFVGSSRTAKNDTFGYIFGYTELSSGYTTSSIPSPFSAPDGTTYQDSYSNLVYVDGDWRYIHYYCYYYIPSSLESVIVTDLTQIPRNAFYNCTNLTNIEIPQSVTSIGKNAFYNCVRLSKFNITNIEAWCNIKFNGYFSNPLFYAKRTYINDILATDIIIPDTTTSIGDYAFYNLTSLKSVTIQNNVTSIGNYAFSGCAGLSEVTIPKSVKSVGIGAFQNCTNLETIELPKIYGNDTEKYFGYIFGADTYLENKNYVPSGLEIVTLSDSCTEIPENAFYDCNYICQIEISKNIETIGTKAFYGCSKIDNITIPKKVSFIGSDAFVGCAELDGVYISDISAWCNIIFQNAMANPLYYAKNLYLNNRLIENLYITNEIVNEFSFFNCENIMEITFSDTVNTIEKSAFYNCVNLKSINFNNSLNSIGDYAFANCDLLKTVILPNSLDRIGEYVFSDCDSLISVTIGNNLEKVSNYAFYNCKSLTSISFSNGLKKIGNYAFAKCDSLRTVTVPQGVESIGEYAFSECNSLVNAVMSTGLEQICKGAFSGDGALRRVTVPRTLIKVEDSAFNNCKLLDIVYYDGTENDWYNIAFGSGNEDFIYDDDDDWTSDHVNFHSHNLEWITDKEATCTVYGIKHQKCSICNMTTPFENYTIEHKYSNSCDKTCNFCGDTRKISHTYKSTLTKATLTKNGKKEYKCTVCGYVASSSYKIYYPKTIKLSATTYTYDGKIKQPSVTVKDSAGKTISSKYYTVTYASGRKNVGKYKVTVTFKGKYSGTKTLYFKINPAKTTVSKLAPGKKSIKVYITKKTSQVTGYQIQYSTSKTFKSYKTKTIKSYKTTSATLKSLSAKKTYYVRVRTYKTVNGTKYYSGWSSYKYTKTK